MLCAWDGVVLRLPKNRMNELFTSGSVGGPAGNRRPYPTGLEVLLELTPDVRKN